jgi:NADPH2:quinone reductase
MKAVVYDEVGGPEVLHLAEVPTPEPADDEVLVRVLAVAVDFIQLHIRHGGSGRIGSPTEPAYGLPPLPRIPGGAACVEVVECGAAVSHVAVGERHLVSGLRPGSYVEYGVASAASLSLGSAAAPGPTAIPASFSPVEAAAFDYAPVAYHTLRVAAGLSAGETVLIHAAAGGKKKE